jgi:hypothetical protein
MRARDALTLAIAVAAAAPLGCVDVVHDDQVQALGDEQSGVSPGPTHRPGQPCLVCHGGQGPSSYQLSLGGTVYQTQGQTAPAVGVQVVVEDITGATMTLDTNSAGNFFMPAARWQPHFPLTMQVTDGTTVQQMSTNAGRDGSCAGCHTASAGPRSPGPIYLNASQGP